MLSRISALCILTAMLATALVAQPTVTSVSPARNLVDATPTTNVTANFSTNMAAPSGSTFRVWSNLRGWLGGNYSGGSSSSLTFDPNSDLLPGEKLNVILTSGLQDTGSNALGEGYQWQFCGAASAGTAVWNKRDVQTAQYQPFDVAFGDLDGDGDIDMITAGAGNVGYDKKYINDGAGNFTAYDIARVADGSYCCALADMDGDGDLDAIIGNHPVNTGGNTISAANRLYWNDGNGNFYTSTTFGTSTDETIDLDVGDVDGDGDLDIVTANGSINGQYNYVYFNDGNGNLTAQAFMVVRTSYSPYADTAWAVRLGDVDGDGDLDAILGISGITSTATSYVYENDGAGNFALVNAASFETAAVVQALATGDFDGDGDLDFIGGGNGTCPSSVYFNDGNGGFTAQQWDSGSLVVDALEAADMDGDGDLDVLVGCNTSTRAFIMFNGGSGNFSSSASTNKQIGTSTVEAWGISVADIDSDGDLDIGTPSYTVFNGSNPPAISVTANGNTLMSGDTVQLANGESVQNAALSFFINDYDGDQISVSTTISNNTTQGFVMSQWTTASTSAPVTLTPTSGTFNVSNISHKVTLTANDGVETSTFVFHIDVGTVANAAPTISVNSYAGAITAGSTVNVNYNSAMSALGMSITIDDADQDNVSLNTQMTNISGMSILTSEWSSSRQSAPYTLYPWTGNFNQHGVVIYVLIEADDGLGGTASFSFYFATSTTGNYAPTIAVTSNSSPVYPFQSINVNYGDSLASLNLQIAINDQNSNNVNMSSSVSNLYSTGIQTSEFQQNGATPLSLTPTSGVFNQGGVTHTVSLYVSDSSGPTVSMRFYIVVGTAPSNTAPAIAVSGTAGTISNGANVNVNYNDTLASLGLAINITDADNDSVALNGTVSMAAGTGILNSEFSNTATAPYGVNPTTGVFNNASVTHTVSLAANDGKGGTANFSFTITVGAIPNSAPVISVHQGGNSVSNGASLNVAYGTTLSTFALAIQISDPDNDSVALSGTVSNSAGTGILNSEFSNTATAPYTVNPSSGTFNQAGATHTVNLSVNDGNGGTANFSFTITVGAIPNSAPAISVSQGGNSVSNGASLNVAYGTTLSTFALAVQISDPDNDSVALSGTVSNSAGTGILNSEFSNTATAPYAVNPSSGTFNQAGVTHSVNLSVNDGNGGSANFSFTIVVGAAPTAVIAVYESSTAGTQITHGAGATGARNFGSQDTVSGATAALTIVVHNSGNAVLNIPSVTMTGDTGDFVLNTTGLLANIGIGASSSFTIAFDPASAGSKVATVNIAHNANGTSNPFSFDVSGVGTTPATAPIIVVSENGNAVANGAAAAAGRAFGSVTLGNPASVTITISNAGNADLTVGAPVAIGPDAGMFSVSGSGAVIPAGSSATFTITYLATTVGVHGATISFSHDDTSTTTPFTFDVSGTTNAAAPAGGTGGGSGGGCVAGSSMSFIGLLFLVLMAMLAVVRNRRVGN